ncbi:MAG: RNA methyltransferase [Thermodesulfobacteriota bacterium]
MNLKRSPGSELYVALLHHPVLNKRGETIVSAITNLDLHDIARASRTYGAERFYVVTPLADQARLARRIINYWTEGQGADYNPRRAEALRLATVKTDLDEVRNDIRLNAGDFPVVVATSARPREQAVGFSFLKELLREKRILLVFGTAWGMAETVLAGADYVLEPIRGRGDYNHLPVRSAVSIMLDRLVGCGI